MIEKRKKENLEAGHWFCRHDLMLPGLVLLFYGYSLTFGFVWDDVREVTSDFERAFEKLKLHFRPIYYLTFAAMNQWVQAAWAHRLINILLLCTAAFLACRLAGRLQAPLGKWAVLAAFMHPTFVYPATWISQRNDGFLLVFVFLTILNIHRNRGLGYLLLSDVSKTPFVLQNFWYAWRRWRLGGTLWPAWVAMAAVPLVVGQALLFWGEVRSEATSPMSMHVIDDFLDIGFVVAVRLAKLLEAWLLVHVPAPAYLGVLSFWAIAAVALIQAAAWAVIGVGVWRARRRWGAGGDLLLLALLMSLPFIANSNMRVLGPVIPFFYLGWVCLAGPGAWVKAALAVILVLNTTASALNYRVSDTGIFDVAQAPDYTLCGAHESKIPMENWRCNRSKVAAEIVRRFQSF